MVTQLDERFGNRTENMCLALMQLELDRRKVPFNMHMNEFNLNKTILNFSP